jgi:hypothetical protein
MNASSEKSTKEFAKIMTAACVRRAYLEKLHFGITPVTKTGMQVELANNGPVTILIDSKLMEYPIRRSISVGGTGWWSLCVRAKNSV